jgi:hypothetical protein
VQTAFALRYQRAFGIGFTTGRAGIHRDAMPQQIKIHAGNLIRRAPKATSHPASHWSAELRFGVLRSNFSLRADWEIGAPPACQM